MHIPPDPGSAPRTAAHRQPPRAPCDNAMTARPRPPSLKLPPGDMATSVWLAGETSEITSLLQVTARLRQQPLGTAGRLGAHPRERFSRLNNATFLSSALRPALLLLGFPFSKGEPLALLSRNFGSGSSALRPSTQPAAPGALLPPAAGSSPGRPPPSPAEGGGGSRVLRPIPGKRSGRGGERR